MLMPVKKMPACTFSSPEGIKHTSETLSGMDGEGRPTSEILSVGILERGSPLRRVCVTAAGRDSSL